MEILILRTQNFDSEKEYQYSQFCESVPNIAHLCFFFLESGVRNIGYLNLYDGIGFRITFVTTNRKELPQKSNVFY
jgi:hypothetical protein